jgi:hypothetical protein
MPRPFLLYGRKDALRDDSENTDSVNSRERKTPNGVV